MANFLKSSRGFGRTSVALAGVTLALGLLAACGGSVTEATTTTGSTGGSMTTGGDVGGSVMTSGSSVGGASMTTGGDVGGSIMTTGGGPGGSAMTTGGGPGGAAMTSGSGMTTGSGMVPVCPGTQPANQDMCKQPGENCDYNGTQCTCSNGGAWHCNPCPAQEPAQNAACMSTGMGGPTICDFGATSCHCHQGQWKCATCPAQEPTDNDVCMDQGLQCLFGATNCSCFNGTWHCPQPCPPAQPKPGDACVGGGMGGQMSCDYGNTTCVCLQGQYFCN